jgi:hypothetical protein
MPIEAPKTDAITRYGAQRDFDIHDLLFRDAMVSRDVA